MRLRNCLSVVALPFNQAGSDVIPRSFHKSHVLFVVFPLYAHNYWKLWSPCSFLTFLLSQAMAVTWHYYARSWNCAQAGLSQSEAVVWFPSLQLKLSLICSSQRAAVFLPEILHSNEEMCVHVCVYMCNWKYTSTRCRLNNYIHS